MIASFVLSCPDIHSRYVLRRKNISTNSKMNY
jgi:hypothetical protein